MRVLLTNWRLVARAGSELYLFDMARWLRDQGHVPVAYAARLGPVADQIRAEAIAVIDDVRLLAEPPDVIHGQHHLSTMTAIAHFPNVPVVAFCHGWIPWEEIPVRHPSIRRYVAVSEHTRQRLVLESGIAPDLVTVVPNFVDVTRFKPRAELPSRLRRALLFSNYAVRGLPWVDSVAAACAAHGISLEISGLRAANPIERPEEYLHSFDLVFAKGRAAIEAMATGAAVILCDAAGLGPMVTPMNFDELRDGNFGMRVLLAPHDRSRIEEAINDYDPNASRAVSELVRGSLSLDATLPRIFDQYRAAIADFKSPRPGETTDAFVSYLTQLNKLDPVPRDAIRRQYESELRRALVAAHETKTRPLEAELETMRGSTSWRFTAPLRRIGAMARRAVQRVTT